MGKRLLTRAETGRVADELYGLREENGRLREALTEILKEVGTSTRTNKIASAALYGSEAGRE